MGASQSGSPQTFDALAKQLLVSNDSVGDADIGVPYGALEQTIKDSRYIGNSSLLDPSGHLSQELQQVLDDEFMKYSNGLLVITRLQLRDFLIACYPQLMSKEFDYYAERVNYILARYGKPFKDVRNHFAKVLNITLPPRADTSVVTGHDGTHSDDAEAGMAGMAGMANTTHDNSNSNDNSDKTQQSSQYANNTSQSNTSHGMAEDGKEREARIVSDSLLGGKATNNTTGRASKSGHNSHGQHGQSSVSIQEDQNVIEKTIHCVTISENELVLPKTKFLLFYRKSCFDREMMVRLELTELGYAEFRGMLVDRSKSVDVLAYKVQQLRNQEETHLEEKERILNAKSAKECADLITQYIQQNQDPLDISPQNDPNNFYRKRRPIKFGACCYHCCPCIVCLARCCC